MKMTKISGWLVGAAALLVMTMGMTACSSEGDGILGDNGSEPTAQATGVRVTVKAGISDLTAGATGGTTRSAVTKDGSTRTLKFTTGDRLYVWKEVDDTYVKYVAGMLTMVGEPSADGMSATFTGEVKAYNNYGNEDHGYNFSADPLEGTKATLVHAAMEDGPDYGINSNSGKITFNESYANDVETLMTKKLQVTGTYTSGSGYSLASNAPIIFCSLSGLAASTTYRATLQYPAEYCYYFNSSGTFTTDASGAGSVAFVAEEDVTHEWQIKIIQGNTTVGIIDLGTRELTAKVYNVTRHFIGSTAYNPTGLATPLTLEALTEGTIVVNYPQSGMQYSLNGGAKTTMTETTTIEVSVGDKVQFYGNGTSITTYFDPKRTKIAGGTANVKVYGNIMSLVDEEGFATNTTLREIYAFCMLFSGNANLTDASGLLLPATTLTKYCYYRMFQGCTSLTTAPATLPAETLVERCYNSMFLNCSSLTTAPALPAEVLANSCYDAMFGNCTSLTTAPVLPAKTLAEYCYQAMFQGCSNLSSVTCLATNIDATDCTTNWLKNAGTQATAPKLYVDPSMIERSWNNSNFTVTAIQ